MSVSALEERGALAGSGNSNNSTDLSPPAYMYGYVTVLNVIIFVVGVIGNVMVLLVIVRMRTLRTRVNYFLASLSVSDLLVLVICQPSAMLVFYTRDQWLLGHVMCQLVPFLEHWTVHASVLTLLVIGLDRYVTICRPGSPLFPPRPALYLSVAWLTAGLFAVPFIFLTSLDTSEYLDGSSVEVCRTKLDGLASQVFVTVTFALMFLLPLFLLGFLYASVISRLRRLTVGQDTIKLGEKLCKRKTTSFAMNAKAPTILTPARSDDTRSKVMVNPATARSRHQVARMLVVIVVLFFVCFTPFKVSTEK
ncbi:galanin receptor type 2-like [Plakobranchus ocellatus]|uniref:Galanin receptor type 2-like n=1 Tax=Plakobranchus ocellatus TaxID=259542 RepID=A0AAV4BES7_9GAST|nr:galanin receptor type 2-like [Plakobranchus ocellatus]